MSGFCKYTQIHSSSSFNKICGYETCCFWKLNSHLFPSFCFSTWHPFQLYYKRLHGCVSMKAESSIFAYRKMWCSQQYTVIISHYIIICIFVKGFLNIRDQDISFYFIRRLVLKNVSFAHFFRLYSNNIFKGRFVLLCTNVKHCPGETCTCTWILPISICMVSNHVMEETWTQV